MLLVTFGLVMFRDLTEGIVVGFALGALLFIDRMAKSIAIEADIPLAEEDKADDSNHKGEYQAVSETIVYRITGAFFFGAASTVGAVLDRIADQHKNFILDCSSVPHLDSTAANVLEGATRKASREDVRFFITGASVAVRQTLLVHGVRSPLITFLATIEDREGASGRREEQTFGEFVGRTMQPRCIIGAQQHAGENAP